MPTPTTGRPMTSLLGVDPYPKQRIPPWGAKRRFPETSLAGLQLTPVEWAAAAAGVLVLTGTAVAIVTRRRSGQKVVRNRRRRTSRRRR